MLRKKENIVRFKSKFRISQKFPEGILKEETMKDITESYHDSINEETNSLELLVCHSGDTTDSVVCLPVPDSVEIKFNIEVLYSTNIKCEFKMQFEVEEAFKTYFYGLLTKLGKYDIRFNSYRGSRTFNLTVHNGLINLKTVLSKKDIACEYEKILSFLRTILSLDISTDFSRSIFNKCNTRLVCDVDIYGNDEEIKHQVERLIMMSNSNKDIEIIDITDYDGDDD